MNPPTIAHVNDPAGYDLYIGRANRWKRLAGSKWGNPFRIGPDGDGPTVLAKYREHVLSRPDLVAALPELAGKRLACWCKKPGHLDAPCHGDVLRELVGALPD